MRGGHLVLDPLRVSSITPPNFGSGAGIRFPSIVEVALRKPTVPVVCCPETGALAIVMEP